MMNFITDLHNIFAAFIGGDEDLNRFIHSALPASGLSGQEDNRVTARALLASFLVCLCGKNDNRYDRARGLLESTYPSAMQNDAVRFFLDATDRIPEEVQQAVETDISLAKTLQQTARHAREAKNDDGKIFLDSVRCFFFPQGAFWPDHVAEARDQLRHKRTVVIDELNPSPLRNIGHELIFSANVLLTTPARNADIDTIDFDAGLRQRLADVQKEEQRFWFDHPIQIGTPPESNEVLYGLRNLHEAVEIEIERGNMQKDERVCCLLSVSVTHEGLKKISRDYLETELKKHGTMDALDIFAFTEDDTLGLINDVLLPLARQYGMKGNDLYTVFGVDGEYGRHYSFLKAVTALWQVFMDDRVKATFKIDLDQVFPQDRLIAETGKSAFEHLMSPLWGACGHDSNGRKVFLGMLAGSLVNEADIAQGLFTPDVTYPDTDMPREERVFSSRVPQALSTEAEMMTRYDTHGAHDGVHTCLQRFHVTGGTNGILVKALRTYRPFTPTLIGRAEDQAYILSVLFDEKAKGLLRYIHTSGLVMRHDKEAFAGEAIAAAKTGQRIGDFIRILLFSEYARSLPWRLDDIQQEINPFTGAFVSLMPNTVVLLRFALSCASLFIAGRDDEALAFLELGVQRIGSVMALLNDHENRLYRLVEQEKQAWHVFYDILDRAEQDISDGKDTVMAARDRARAIIAGCRVAS